jgi:PAS domain S-box-containing protein
VIDVHDRNQAEDALRDSEQRLHLALEAGRMGTWSWELSTDRVDWSPALEALHGLAPGSFEGTLEAFSRDMHPEDRERVLGCIGRTLENGEDHHVEYRILPPGGGLKWVEGRGKLYRDAAGRPQRMVGVCADVTERKLWEEGMRRSVQALNDFFETAAVGLHWVGPDGTVLRANPTELQMLGYSREEYEGRNISEFHVDRDAIQSMLERLAAGERVHEHPAQMRCRDGSVRDVLVTSSGRFEDGRLVHTRCFTVDVTARKEAERGLVARARQQEAVAELGELALRERDLQKVFQHATAALARTLEVEYAKVLELLPGGSEVLLRAGVGWKPGLVGTARVSTGLDSQAGYTLSSGAPVVVRDLGTENRFRGPALLTEHGVVSGMSCVIRERDAEPWGVLGVHSSREIAFTRDDVNFLSSVANVLGHAIHRDRSEAALREADRHKDEFIAVLAHELRNPLAPLRAALEIMRATDEPGLDGRMREIMDRQVAHLVRLVDDLLEVSRISTGIVELRRQPVLLADVLRAAIESSEPLMLELGHRLETELTEEPIWIDGDAVRLTQCFTNLLNNSARYTPRGGRIWLRVRRSDDGNVLIFVRDTGAGFASQKKEALFEMFSRGEGSLGLGVGLALVRRLIEMHDGSVDARSEGPGLGSEFVVELPVSPAAAEAHTAQVAMDPVGGLRIVVADDNHDAAESLAALLAFLGNDVTVVHDGIDAVEAARTLAPHLMLIDIGMPRLDGYGAARQIRENSVGPRIRLVALTGWGQDEDRRRAREAGFDEHLVKPAGTDALRRVLAAVRREGSPASPGGGAVPASYDATPRP